MNTQNSYDEWSAQYDSNINKTRDLEGIALRQALGNIKFNSCLEIGCGTGKNTSWLLTKAEAVMAVDFSAGMLEKAKQKITASNVKFIQANILQDWFFVENKYDLVSFSLVLEHIENLDAILEKAAQSVSPGGYLYIGELHPFKQYAGTKARFETEAGTQVVSCFDHHISDFISAAEKNGFRLEALDEYFDDHDRRSIPRILSLLFKMN